MTTPRTLASAVGLRCGAIALAALVVGGCGSDGGATSTSATTIPVAATSTTAAERVVELLQVEVRDTVAHDAGAFTQGLVFDATGRLFESTGLEGQSTLREVDPSTGEVLRSVAIDDSLFGEGLALVGNRLVQLTWQDERALVYDVETFEQIDELEYDGEGWGLCHDGTRLVMSNGTDTLTFRDPDTFADVGSIVVTDSGEPVTELNELECVDGAVYANVWNSDRIVRIDPVTGAVVASIDAAALGRPAEADVLNGIAVDPEGALWLTGKLWDAMYRVDLVPA